MMFPNIFVVMACTNEGKNLDCPFSSKPMLATRSPMSKEVSMLITIHHKIPSKALKPKTPAAVPMKIFAHTLVWLSRLKFS